MITLQFSLALAIDVAEQEVQAAINAASNLLPSDLPNPPIYSKINPADSPILTLALTSSSLPLSKVEDLAETTLSQKISQLPGVGLVSISGGQRPAVRIQANPTSLAAYGLSLEDLRTALGQANVDQAKGNFDGPHQAFTIGANDQLLTSDGYRPLIIAYKNGAPVRLSDVATVFDGAENAKQAAWANEHPAVILNIQRQPGANIIAVVDRVKRLLPQLQASLPGAVDVAMAVGAEKLKDTGYAGLISPKIQDDGTRVNTSAPANFSLLVPAYRERYGVAPEEFRAAMTHVAAKNHANGALNPRAQFRRAVSNEAIERSPVVAGELGVMDCSGVADGAAAAIVTRAEDARKYTGSPLSIKALALVTGDGSGAADPRYDYTSFPEVVDCARRAYAQAGITDPRRELALAEVHDCFTPTEIVLMEDLGFAERGHAWRDVLDGVYDRDGELPVNPDGGLKSFGHPVGASGLRMIYECWLQLRGQAGARQVATAHRGLALTQNLGGAPGDCVCFISVLGSKLA